MKVAQNDETNPNKRSVRPPHISIIPNVQHSPSVSSARKHETPGILSRMFFILASITSYRVRSHVAPPFAMLCFVMLLFALLFICFPLRCFFSVDPETIDASVFDYDYASEDSFRLQGSQASPPLITRYRLFSSLLLLH